MSETRHTADVLVIGAGPAGTIAALRAADLGARTTLVTDGDFGGMAANDGPVPVRTLAHAARLMREARQLTAYGVVVSEPRLDYARLLERVSEVVEVVRANSALRREAEMAGVNIRERAGRIRFVDAHTVATPDGEHLRGERIILCTGGVSRRLDTPGAELAAIHSDAWLLQRAPASVLVIGAGATGAQLASVLNALGARVQLFQAADRIIPTEEEEVSSAVARAFRAAGIEVNESFGAIEAFEKTPQGVRMIFTKGGVRKSAEAELAVTAVGWSAGVENLNLSACGVATNARGFIVVDARHRTSAGHIYAAGDVTGGLMLAPQAMQAGFAAVSNAVLGDQAPFTEAIHPIGSFTDPEYAQVGLGEAAARKSHDTDVTLVPFDDVTRAIIDGRTIGFCKLIVDRADHRILGCHIVGDRAVDVVQIAAVAMAGGLRVDDLARLPFSFPTYAGILAKAAAIAARKLSGGGAAPPLRFADPV